MTRGSVRFSLLQIDPLVDRRLSAVCMPNTIERELFSPREGIGLLAGDWFSQCDSVTKLVQVKGDWAMWPNTGPSSEGGIFSKALIAELPDGEGTARGRVFSLTLRGMVYRGVVSKTGGAVIWNDGDIWVRGIGRHASVRRVEKQSALTMAHHYVDTVLAPPLIDKCTSDAFEA